jgi:hypothetical protein
MRVSDEEHGQLAVLIAEVATKMQVLLDKQDELAENISKIKEAVYNPDKGLYARLSHLDRRLDSLESWRNLNTKILWTVGTITAGLVIADLWQSIF